MVEEPHIQIILTKKANKNLNTYCFRARIRNKKQGLVKLLEDYYDLWA